MSVIETVQIAYRHRWAQLGLIKTQIPATPQPNQLRIQVKYIALNPIDIKLKTLALLPIPKTVGREFSGTVTAVGSNQSDNYKVGDRVSVFTGSPFEGYVGTEALLDVTKHSVVKPPAKLSDEEAAAFPVAFAVAFSALDLAKQRGSLLVLGGASTTGTYAIQLAKKQFGFSTVVATCSSASSARVRAAGADKTVDYRVPDLSKELVDLNTTFDVIFDAAGGYDALRVWPQILRGAQQGGLYVSIVGDVSPSGSYSASFLKPSVSSLPWMVPRILFGRYFGINYQFLSGSNLDWTTVAPKFLAEHDVVIPVDSVYKLSDAQRAWDKLNTLQAHGKVLIDMSSKTI